MTKPLFVLGSSYRCGSTLIQRLLNNAVDENGNFQCLIEGEGFADTIKGMSYNFYNSTKENAIELNQKCNAMFNENTDCWSASAGHSITNRMGFYRRWIKEYIVPPQGGRYGSCKYTGLKFINIEYTVPHFLIQALHEDGVELVFIYRNLKDSYKSYAKQPWRHFTIDNFTKYWSMSMECICWAKKHIGEHSHFIDYNTINPDVIGDLFDKLELDKSNIQSVLNNKIKFLPDSKELELTSNEEFLLEQIAGVPANG